jgi:hypothetical protein
MELPITTIYAVCVGGGEHAIALAATVATTHIPESLPMSESKYAPS